MEILKILKEALAIIVLVTVCVVIVGNLVAIIFEEICSIIRMQKYRRKDKRSSKFGRYPSCDMLNNAIRFLHNGDTDNAMIEIIFAIDKAGGYFHEDNAQIVEEARKTFWEKHSGRIVERDC